MRRLLASWAVLGLVVVGCARAAHAQEEPDPAEEDAEELVEEEAPADDAAPAGDAAEPPVPDGAAADGAAPADADAGDAAPAQLHERGVLGSILERMDVDLPDRLTDEDYAMLVERCAEPGQAWEACVTAKGLDDDGCGELEETLATCVAQSDDVTELYLAVADEKKTIVGDEIYTSLAGLLAVLPMDKVKALHASCPQTTIDDALPCLLADDDVGAIVAVYQQLAQEVVTEAAQEVAAAGGTLDVEAYTEQVLELFLTLPSHTIASVAGECEKAHPELATVTDASVLDKGLQCIRDGAQTDPVANPAYISKERLLEWLGIARGKVVGQIKKQEASKQDQSFDRILIVIVAFAGLGFVGVLLLPVFLAKKYPGQGPALWRSSAVAAATLAVTVALLGASLLTIRAVQGSVAADSTSPKMRVADAAFAVLSKAEYVEGFSEISKYKLDFIKKPLRGIVGARVPQDPETYAVFVAYLVTHWANLLEEPELRPLAQNVAMVKRHAASLRSVTSLYKKIDWLMGIVPIVLSLLAVVLYVLPMKDTLVDIAAAPARQARGEAGAAPVGAATRTVWAEVKSALPFLGIIVVLLPLTGLFLARAVEPVVELLINYALLTFFYILQTASGPVLYLSLGAVMLLLVLCLAVYIVTMAFFLGTARKILRAIFHGGHKVAEFRRFWIWGGLSTLLLLALPFTFVLLARWLAFGPLEPNLDRPGTGDMLTVPLVALLAFPVVFWAARGWKALMFIKKYPVPKGKAAG